MAATKAQTEIVPIVAPMSPGYLFGPLLVVTKVEFRLRTSNTTYTRAIGSPAEGPKGKIPYLDVTTPGQPTTHLADSTLITKSLIESGLISDLNKSLSLAQKSVDLAIRALFEEKLYFLQAHERWIMNYESMRDHVLANIPLPQRLGVGEHAKAEIVKKLDLQGTGRFTNAEVRAAIKDIWEGLAGLLEAAKANASGGECFWVLGGAEPTEADATVFGFAVSVLVVEAGPESTALVEATFPVVVEYMTRVCERWFKDYKAPWLKT